MKRLFGLIACLLCVVLYGHAQRDFKLENNKKSDKIRFQLINNLMVIPVEINGVELSFLLDTGVAKPIIFGFLNERDTLKINNTEAYFLSGLGEGDAFEALKSKNNIFKIGDAISLNQDMYAIRDSSLNFTPQLGVPVHGIIGFDLFKDFIVEINYAAKYIKLYNPKFYKYRTCKKCEILNLEFYNNKPYINAKVNVNSEEIPVKLLIDSGGSDALWLFENPELGLYEASNYFEDFLGHGLSGTVHGKRSKVKSLQLKSFKLKQVNVAYPDSIDIALARKFKQRNGSLSGNVLKRFNLVVDYSRARLTLKKNRYFKKPFSYNKSGIEIEHHGVRVVEDPEPGFTRHISENSIKINLNQGVNFEQFLKPAFVIVELREDSPAKRAGLLIGDIILSVNNRQTHHYKLQEIVHLFYGDEGEYIRMKVDRNGYVQHFKFQLESPLK